MAINTVVSLPIKESPYRRSQVAIVVPTSNAAKDWAAFSAGILAQGFAPEQVVIIDSSSTDGTPQLALQAGFRLVTIERKDFNHGGTRQAALAAAPWAEIAVYLTQDAILAASDSIEKLIAPFSDPTVGATCGRQLPRPSAGPLEAHARLFNYPPQSAVRSWESRKSFGIKAAFLSNSFSAYRISALNQVGGFPSNVIMAEDAIVAAKLLMNGWKTVYVSEAPVYHSHPYTIVEEFKRYFDIGVCHSQNSWLTENFGSADGEGKKFVKSEIAYLAPKHAYLIPVAFFRSVSKILGYRLGWHERSLPLRAKKSLSMHRHFWR